jgi:hypothetical protein
MNHGQRANRVERTVFMKTIMAFLTFCFIQLFIETAFAQYNASQPTSIYNRPTNGQWLLREGIDTSKADQIRSAFINNSYADIVLEYLAERPDPQYTENIAAFMRQHTEQSLILAAGKALLQLGDARGIYALDSLISKTVPRDSYYAYNKLEAINAFATKGVYNYVDTLLSNYLFLIRSGSTGKPIFSTMQLYANRAEYHDRVLSTMIDSYSSSMDYHIKDDIVFAFDKMNTQQGYEFLLNVLKTDTTYLTRAISLDCLRKKPTAEFLSYIFQAAQTEPNEYMRSDFFYNLYWLETPAAFFRIKQIIQTESNYCLRETIIRLANWFKPKTPDAGVSLNTLIDSLASIEKQVIPFNWLGDGNFINKLDGYLTNAKNNLNAGNQIDCARQIRIFQQKVDNEYRDSTNATPAFVTVEAWKFLYCNAQYILDRLPQIPPSGCNVKLVNSTSTKLTGGALQYYEGSWKDATNNNDGTFFISTTTKTLNLKMTYEYGIQTKSNVMVGYDTVTFQTVNAQIQLQNSSGVLIDTGTVQYYAGAWRNLGTTINGTATKELLPASYSFRMTYAYASKDKQQDIGTNSTVVFQTVNAAVQLQNSQGTLIDQGAVQYYSGAWRDLGTTTNGLAKKELLPNSYSFRMTHAYASKDKQQDIGTNATVVFQTVNAAVQLQNSQGALMPAPLGDQGTVQYYSGAWRDLGATTNGVANKELLPNNYSFRMTYAYASKDKQQDINTNPIVIFQTINAAVQLQNSQGALMPASLWGQGTVQYYSGAWRDLGTTTNGIAKKELLPNSYSFRMTYEYVSLDKAQDISTNNTVSFSTVLCTIRVKNSQNQPVNNAMASYYSGAWRQIGNTVNGIITKELLPVNLSFRIKYGTQQIDKQQNLSTNTVVEFGIQ